MRARVRRVREIARVSPTRVGRGGCYFGSLRVRRRTGGGRDGRKASGADGVGATGQIFSRSSADPTFWREEGAHILLICDSNRASRSTPGVICTYTATGKVNSVSSDGDLAKNPVAPRPLVNECGELVAPLD